MKHTQRSSILLLLVMALFVSSCINFVSSKKESSEDENEDKIELEGNLTDNDGDQVEIDNVDDAVSALTDALSGLQNGKKVEAVDFRELKKMMPEKLMGLDRTSLEGERSGMAGFNFSQAEAEYEDGDKTLDVSIVDGAGFAGIMTGMAAWSLLDVDRESDDGYERTTTIDGYKAYEKYNSNTKRGQISLIVEDRFIVNIEGDEMSPKDLKKVIDKLGLNKLKRAI